MAFQLLLAFVATTLLIVFSVFTMRQRSSQTVQNVKESDQPELMSSLPEPTMLSKSLASALPESVILPHDTVAFE